MYEFITTIFVVGVAAFFAGLLAREGERWLRFQVVFYSLGFVAVVFWFIVLTVRYGVSTA